MPTLRFSTPRLAALAPALASAALLAAAPVCAEAVSGQPAPRFTASASDGSTVDLDALKGKTVVLEWTNDECPYTVKHYATGNMQALQKEAAASGVVWLTVASSAPGQQGHADAAKANRLTAERKAAPAKVLLDAEGTLGRLYGARSTPHMFVVAPDGTLAYQGAIDDQPGASPDTVKSARNCVREAIAAVQAGKAPAVATTRAYGCSIKYAPPS